MPISKEEQIITVFLHRFNRFFVPTLKHLKIKVERGEELEQSELIFLEQVLTATQDILPKMITHPKYSRIFVGAIRYYNSITKQALINSQNNTVNDPGSTKDSG